MAEAIIRYELPCGAVMLGAEVVRTSEPEIYEELLPDGSVIRGTSVRRSRAKPAPVAPEAPETPSDAS
jgi:hypothetical protein